jgi:hypothetical protein
MENPGLDVGEKILRLLMRFLDVSLTIRQQPTKVIER